MAPLRFFNEEPRALVVQGHTVLQDCRPVGQSTWVLMWQIECLIVSRVLSFVIVPMSSFARRLRWRFKLSCLIYLWRMVLFVSGLKRWWPYDQVIFTHEYVNPTPREFTLSRFIYFKSRTHNDETCKTIINDCRRLLLILTHTIFYSIPTFSIY